MRITGEATSSSLCGSMVHHGSRGRSTSNGAGSTHREYDSGRITTRPLRGGSTAAACPRTRRRPCRWAAVGQISDRLGTAIDSIDWASGLVSRACRVLPFSLFTPSSGVDSAEADEVGSHGIRFCAYVDIARDEACGIAAPPRRAFLLALNLCAVSVIAGSGSPRRSGPHRSAGTSSCRTGGRSARSSGPDSYASGGTGAVTVSVPGDVRPAEPSLGPNP